MVGIIKHASALAFALSFSAIAMPASLLAQAPAPAAATAADIKASESVRDSKGVQVATIVEPQGSNVVLDTGQTKIGVPLNLLAKDSQGLMLTITADQFNAAIAKAHARAEAAKTQQAQPDQAAQPQAQAQPPKH